MVCAPLLYAENTLLACCIYRIRDKNIPMLLYKTSQCNNFTYNPDKNKPL